MTLLATSDETDGTWSLFQYAADPDSQGPEPHWREEMDEGFYILEGAVDLEIDGEGWRAGPGEFVHVPPRTVHTFAVDSGGPAAFLIYVSPVGSNTTSRSSRSWSPTQTSGRLRTWAPSSS